MNWKTLGPVFAPADDPAAAAAAADPAGGAAAAALAAGAAADPAAAPAAEAAKAGEDPWWKGNAFSDDQRNFLLAKGLTVDDPVEALKRQTDMYRHAETRLGRPADTLLEAPKKDQPLSDWMRENAKRLGLPEKPEDIKIARPEDWPKDAAWNDKLETGVREVAVRHGIAPAAVQDLVNLYAGEIRGLDEGARVELETATAAMLGDLRKEWGDQTDARVDRARLAANALAEQAGMGQDQLLAVTRRLALDSGDANVLRLFDAVGELMGEDRMVAPTGGIRAMGATPAEARAELARQNAPGGDWYEASKARNLARMKDLQPRITQLEKLAAQGK